MSRGRIDSLVIGYGAPPNPRRGITDAVLDGFGIARCPKCQTHLIGDKPCPGCARAAIENYNTLIDIEEGRR
jgi:hypothetical protein